MGEIILAVLILFVIFGFLGLGAYAAGYEEEMRRRRRE